MGWGVTHLLAGGSWGRRQHTRRKGPVAVVRGPSPAVCGVGGRFKGAGGWNPGALPGLGQLTRRRGALAAACRLTPARGTAPAKAEHLGTAPQAETPALVPVRGGAPRGMGVRPLLRRLLCHRQRFTCEGGKRAGGVGREGVGGGGGAHALKVKRWSI